MTCDRTVVVRTGMRGGVAVCACAAESCGGAARLPDSRWGITDVVTSQRAASSAPNSQFSVEWRGVMPGCGSALVPLRGIKENQGFGSSLDIGPLYLQGIGKAKSDNDEYQLVCPTTFEHRYG